MNFAKVDDTGLILDVIVAQPTDVFPEGTWVPCPDWLGIGLNINDPEPAPPEQPTVEGAQEL